MPSTAPSAHGGSARLGANPPRPHELVVNPGVGALEAVFETRRWLPTQRRADPGVVGITAVHAPGCSEVVASSQGDAGDLLDNAHELIDGHQLAGAEIDRIEDLAFGDRPGPVHA